MIPEKKKRLATLIQNRMLFSLLLDTISPKYRPLFIVKVWMLKCEKKIFRLILPYYWLWPVINLLYRFLTIFYLTLNLVASLRT